MWSHKTQTLIDPIAPETLETDLGHGDGPQTSESLNNDSTLSTKVKQSGQSLEEKLGHDESALKGQLFDPVDHDPSWATSDSFKSFLETNFRRSLSSSQIFSILEQTSLPDLDVFTTPKLDKTIIDQVPSQFKKSVEIRDKELLKVQRHVLNVAAPLTALHDLLENNQTVSVTKTLGIVEKALCLLGNASNSLSVLRRYKVLYAINPKKVSLAEASYPNAEKQLFGSDITKIASESADITRNLQKNLSQSHSYSNNRFQFGKYQSKKRQVSPALVRAPKIRSSKKEALSTAALSATTLSPKPTLQQQLPLTGRLRFFHANWLNITRGSVYFKCSSRFQNLFSLHACSVSCTSGIRSKLNNQKRNCIATKKGAIRQVPFSHDGFYHRLFLVPKKGGGQRPVLDLSALNQFIETEHFKMENLVTLKSLLNKGDYMINLDLTDAYLTVPMHPDSRKFLRFLLGDKTYEFTAMPFGLNVAPRLFTKIMKPVVASLRSQGFRLIIYLDDILIIASSIETLNRHKTLAISLLESLGFLINYEKSNLTPSQQIVFLGVLVDSASMQFILPQQKAVQIQKECRLLNTNRPTIRHLSRVLGLLEVCRPAIWSAPLHYRQLQTLQINALQRWANYNAPVYLTPSAKSDLSWWVTTLQTPQGSPIVLPIADLTISSDASKQGWGASWGSQRTRGLWSEKESQDHINVLELRAAFFALKSFLPTQTNKVICLKLDNTTAVSYLNNLGGTHCPQLLHLAIAIWDWCKKRHLFLLAQHIPGKTNVEADTESRVKRDLNDWRIPPKIIAPLIRDCTIDLLILPPASHTN